MKDKPTFDEARKNVSLRFSSMIVLLAILFFVIGMILIATVRGPVGVALALVFPLVIISVMAIKLLVNRGLMRSAFAAYCVFVILFILLFACLYSMDSFVDRLKFSVATWYGGCDLQPVCGLALTETIIGYVYMAILAGFAAKMLLSDGEDKRRRAS